MGVDTSKWQVQDYLDNAPAVGLLSSNFVPQALRSQCSNVAQNSVPPSAPSTFVTACTASLIIRGILYFKNTPGDCGTPTQLNLTASQATSAIGGVAVGIASMAGAALPGIGAAVNAIATIFANHAKAVATEQSTICAVANVINQVIPYYDALVRAGKISPSTAYAGMQNFLNQVNAQLAAIEKTCDAACVYQGILKAHSAFVQTYWPQIAPPQVSSHAPGAPPVSITAPGGVVTVGTSSPLPKQNPAQGQAGHVAVAGDVITDYFGTKVTLGTPFFSSSAGGTVLPGTAGDYFTAAQLAEPNVNPWGLTTASKITDGQYSQIAANYGISPLKSSSSGDWVYLGAIAAVVLFIFFIIRKGA